MGRGPCWQAAAWPVGVGGLRYLTAMQRPSTDTFSRSAGPSGEDRGTPGPDRRLLYVTGRSAWHGGTTHGTADIRPRTGPRNRWTGA